MALATSRIPLDRERALEPQQHHDHPRDLHPRHAAYAERRCRASCRTDTPTTGDALMPDRTVQMTTGVKDGRSQARGEQISRIDPVLADLYTHTCCLVKQPISAISMPMLSHAMRELLNGLADVLAKMEGIESPVRQDHRRQIESLVGAWKTANLPTEEATDTEYSADVLQPIPSVVYRAVQAVVRGQQQVTANSSEKMARIVSTGADIAVPAAKQLKKTYEFFTGWCYVTRGEPRALPAATYVVDMFTHFERVIDIRLARFFDVKSDLDDILRVTNQPKARANEETSGE